MIKRSIAIIITNDKNEILLEKYNIDYIINRYKDVYEIDFEWSLPVGKVNKEDTTVGDAVKREASEELGIKITDMKHLFTEILYIQNQAIECNYFTINSYDGTIINNEPEKHIKIEFIPIEKMKKLKLNAMTQLFLKRLDFFV